MKELKLFTIALANVLGKPTTFFSVVSSTVDTRYPILKKCCLKIFIMNKECQEEIFTLDKTVNIVESSIEETYETMQREAMEYLLKYYNVQ